MQREAASYTEGPLLIIAGAGAGKTKTLGHRIIEIIKKGTAPSHILAITFTNKAAREMGERVEKLIEEEISLNLPVSTFEKPFVSTFHALGVHIIRENSKLLGLGKNFSILDRTESKRAVRDALRNVGLSTDQYEPGKMLSLISRQKSNGITLKEFENGATSFIEKTILRVWTEYEKILVEDKALDFDDLLLKSLHLLKDNPELLEQYQNTWKYIHIDEYQDTNKIQNEMALTLADTHKNICVVGDADQNIYSWRGAEIKNILNFEKKYPEVKIVLLEQNYRSTHTIITVANDIIKKNKYRFEKNLFTKGEVGEKISLFAGFDEVDEAHFIAGTAKKLIEEGKMAKDICVLFRANFQSRVLEEAFLHLGVPYQVLGTKFFERKEVKDILSYVRASLDRESLADIKRIINVPARGIGKVTLLKIFSKQTEKLPSSTKEKIYLFYKKLDEIKEIVETNIPSEALKKIIKLTGFEEMFSGGKDEDLERLENIKELVSLSKKYDGYTGITGIETLLIDASLASDQDTLIKDENAVKLMTVHASKGLEFDTVFISGLEDGLFPHSRLSDDSTSEESEEERRLFYVALTRAKKKLFLTYAQTRMIFGSKEVNMPSEFIIDIEDEHVVTADRIGTSRSSLLDIEF